MRVRAKEKMYYGGRDRLPGEEYDMDDRESSEVNILCLLGKIERADELKKPAPPDIPPAVPAPGYQTAAAEPEGEQAETQEEAGAEGEEGSTTPRRRQYRRRDMRPEK